MRVRASKLFSGISAEEYKRLKQLLGLEPYLLADGKIIVREGGTTDFFWIIVSGKLKGERLSADGHSDLVHIYSDGDLVCFDVVHSNSRKSILQISSMGESEVIAVNYKTLADSLLYLTEETRSKITENTIMHLADDSIRKQYKIDVLYKKQLRERIITFLQHMQNKTGSDSFDIGMDREHFAQYLGVNRTALSHALSLMREDGLIEFKRDHFDLIGW